MGSTAESIKLLMGLKFLRREHWKWYLQIVQNFNNVSNGITDEKLEYRK